jgi:hypothetical protein
MVGWIDDFDHWIPALNARSWRLRSIPQVIPLKYWILLHAAKPVFGEIGRNVKITYVTAIRRLTLTPSSVSSACKLKICIGQNEANHQ